MNDLFSREKKEIFLWAPQYDIIDYKFEFI